MGLEAVHCVDVHWGVSAALQKLEPTVVQYVDLAIELSRSYRIPTVS
jgi:hypothetical protein